MSLELSSASIIGDIALGIGILINTVVVIWVLWRTRDLTKTIQILEINTNSIKDALIKTTAEAERAKGILEGKAWVKEQQSGPTDDPNKQ